MMGEMMGEMMMKRLGAMDVWQVWAKTYCISISCLDWELYDRIVPDTWMVQHFIDKLLCLRREQVQTCNLYNYLIISTTCYLAHLG